MVGTAPASRRKKFDTPPRKRVKQQRLHVRIRKDFPAGIKRFVPDLLKRGRRFPVPFTLQLEELDQDVVVARLSGGVGKRLEEFTSLTTVEIPLDGIRYSGTYRVMTGSVIVYYKGEIKFASFGMNRPEVVAKWLLTDLARRGESSARKQSAD